MKIFFMKYIAVTFLCLVIFPASALGEVYKWKDEDGKLHYGDNIPEQYKNKSEKIDVKNSVIKSVPKKKNNRNIKTISAILKAPEKSNKPSSKGKSTKGKSYKLSCAKKWEEYNKSKVCYNNCAILLPGGGRNIAPCKCIDIVKPSCEIRN